MNTISSRTKIETGTAMLGAGIAAVGALTLHPWIIGTGAVIATLATIFRISDRRKAQQPKVIAASSRIAAY